MKWDVIGMVIVCASKRGTLGEGVPQSIKSEAQHGRRTRDSLRPELLSSLLSLSSKSSLSSYGLPSFVAGVALSLSGPHAAVVFFS